MSVASVLDPLVARYASWLALSGSSTSDISDEDPDDVLLMPIVSRIERGDPPSRTAMLESAASAAIAVCLDERSAPGGPWHEPMVRWISRRIRKVTRRARGTHWQAVVALHGHTSAVGNAEVRAFVPLRVSEMPKELTRLQISGSELEPDAPGPPSAGVPTLWLNPDVPMTAGKSAAQVGHATMILAALLRGDGRDDELEQWRRAGFPCSVRTAAEHTWQRLNPGSEPRAAWQRHGVAAVRDAGFTEIDPGTITVLAQWAG